MNTPKTSDDVMREMNDLAKRLGRYPSKHAWEIEPTPGSILDVPTTPEEQARIRRFDEWIARLKRENAAAEQQDERDRTEESTDRASMPATNNDAPANKPS